MWDKREGPERALTRTGPGERSLAMKFQVENMTCGGCARSVAATIRQIDPAAEVTADPATGLVEVASARVTVEAARAALDAAGFPMVAGGR